MKISEIEKILNSQGNLVLCPKNVLEDLILFVKLYKKALGRQEFKDAKEATDNLLKKYFELIDAE